jgi:hypothetical protein
VLTTDFIAEVRRHGSISAGYADADILKDGDAEIRARFIPLLESLRQNFFVRTLTASPDALGRVPLPERAVGAALRSVQLSLGGASWVSIPNRALEDADFQSGGQPCAYFLDAGSICLLPSGSSGSLRIRYAARPGRMCLDTDASLAAPLTAVTTGASSTTFTSVFSGSTTSVDFVAFGPAHQQKAMGVLAGGGTTLNTGLQEALAIGDYICGYDRTPFVPLPEELSAALVHRAAGVILRSQGYDEEASAQLTLAEDAIRSAKPMLIPRNEGNPQRVTGGIRKALNMYSRGRRLY